jgi:hypothetical protein
MHSDLTLDIMDEVTASLGDTFRHFSDEICPAYNTKELPREANARRRRQSKKPNQTEKAKPSDGTLLKKMFNLRTYKYHSLGDYCRTIRWLGTTESYSTTVVSIIKTYGISPAHRDLQGELEHRRPKGWHVRTDRRDFVKQMTRIERRQARIRRIKHKLTAKMAQVENVASAPEAHHHIGSSQNRYEHIPSFLHAHEGDPAILVCAVFTDLKCS